MDKGFKQRFMERWETYFPGVELPVTFYYTDVADQNKLVSSADAFRCIICDLARVRQGNTLYFDVDGISCGGAKRYLGFVSTPSPNFEYFLSYGIPGEMEGERYKKSPELVIEHLKRQPPFEAPGRYIVFKRWDELDEDDEPAVVIFFATPDVLSGLYTLAIFDELELEAVIAPFGSGCSSIVYHPYQELVSEQQRAVLGMFDVSARPCVSPDQLSFAVPWPKFVRMVGNMEESFLITPSWQKVQSRITRNKKV